MKTKPLHFLNDYLPKPRLHQFGFCAIIRFNKGDDGDNACMKGHAKERTVTG